MKDRLTFEVIAYDSALPQTGSKKLVYFTDTNSNNEACSITLLSEQFIIKFVFNHESAKELIFKKLDIPLNSKVVFEVKHPLVSPREPDIDVMIYKESEPHKTIAIQVKRVKVEAVSQKKDKVNKIEDIKKGIKQANITKDLGFYKVYLMILAEVDGRERKEYNFLSRGMTPQTFTQLYEIATFEKLYREIGIIIVEIVQPVDKDITQAGAIGVCLLRDAKPEEQKEKLTNKIKGFIRYREKLEGKVWAVY